MHALVRNVALFPAQSEDARLNRDLSLTSFLSKKALNNNIKLQNYVKLPRSFLEYTFSIVEHRGWCPLIKFETVRVF